MNDIRQKIIDQVLQLPYEDRAMIVDAVESSLLVEQGEDDLAGSLEVIDQSMKDIEAGRTRPLRDSLRDMAAKLNLTS